MKDSRSTVPAYILFSLITPLYLVHQILTRTRYVLDGEMFAEMSTNYYAYAQSPFPAIQLLSTDAGYIPLPQRLIGVFGTALGLPMTAVPYFYTFSALVLSGLIVGVIVLPVFRSTIPSDALRFLLACGVLLVIDFETRIYLNFTYLAVVPLLFLAALAIAQPARVPPPWIWLAPVFALSKPTVLAALPAFVLAGLTARGRFRRVAVITAIAGALQVFRLALSAQTEVTPLQQDPDADFGDVITTALHYTLGFTGRVLLDPVLPVDRSILVAGGGALLVGLLAVAAFGRSRSGGLILASLSLILFGMLLDSATFPALYASDGALLETAVLDRRALPAVAGAMTALAATASILTSSTTVRRRVGRLLTRLRMETATERPPQAGLILGPLLFGVWFAAVGWIPYAAAVNQPAPAAVGGVDQWVDLSAAMAQLDPVVCIPVAPLGWPVSGRNCSTIAGMGPFAPVSFATAGQSAAKSSADLSASGQTVLERTLTLDVPASVTEAKLGSVAVLVRPGTSSGQVSATLRLWTEDGRSHILMAEDRLPLSGGVLMFGDHPVQLLPDVVTAELVVDARVEIGWTPGADGSQMVAGIWMGQ